MWDFPCKLLLRNISSHFPNTASCLTFPLREARHSALNLPNNNRRAPIQLLSGTSDSQRWSNNMPWHLVSPRLSHGCQWWAGGPSICLVRLIQSDKIFVYIHMTHFFQAGVCQHIDVTEWQKQNQPKIPLVWLQAIWLNRTKQNNKKPSKKKKKLK